MFEILIFTQRPQTYAPKRIKEESSKLGLASEIISYKKADINNLPVGKFVILREPDAKKNIYYLRDEILNFYLNSESKVLNSNSYLKWSVLDKITQHEEFENADIPHIKLLNLLDVEYPFIAKSKLGSHGSHVFKVENKGDLDKILKTYDAKDLLIQEFQKTGFDLRVIVLGGKVLGIMKRTPKPGGFLSNFSQGGSVEKYEERDIQLIENIAIKTAEHFKLDYVGVDLMKGNDGKWKVLEVNRACQFKGFEQATGVNVALEIVNFLTK